MVLIGFQCNGRKLFDFSMRIDNNPLILVFPNALYDNVGTHEDDYEDDLKTPTIENVLSLNEVRHYRRTVINEVFVVKQIISVLRLDWKLITALLGVERTGQGWTLKIIFVRQ